MEVTVRCGLGARVAVLGANGAGKSTLIKMITGEGGPLLMPQARESYLAEQARRSLGALELGD